MFTNETSRVIYHIFCLFDQCHHPGCGRKFTTIYNLNTHLKLHERPCTEPCPEEGCGMSFPTKRQLDIHLRTVHQYEDHTFK